MMNTLARAKSKTISVDDSRRKALGNWIREQRIAKGFTMRDMAAISGKPHSYFGKIEQSQRGLDVLEFIELCEWLGLSSTNSLAQIIGSTLQKYHKHA